MAQVKGSTRGSRSGWRHGAAIAAALAAAAGLGGCASTSDFAGAPAPYQVAGPVVAKTPVQSAYRGCDGGAGFADSCSGFPHYYGP